MRRQLRIGEAASLLGVSTKTIRHYQKIGLLAEPARSAAGYRLYGGDDLLRLLRIRRWTALGLSLAQIRQLLARPGDRQPLRQALAEMRADLDASIARLSERRTAIDRLLAEAEGGGDAGLDEPGPPPPAVDAALEKLRAQLTGVDPATLDRALATDRRLFGLLHELRLPGGPQRLVQVVEGLAADPAPLAAVLPLLGRWVALADLPPGETGEDDSNREVAEISALAAELAAALRRPLAAGAGPAAASPLGPLGDVLAELTRGTLSPAQSRVLVRDRLRPA